MTTIWPNSQYITTSGVSPEKFQLSVDKNFIFRVYEPTVRIPQKVVQMLLNHSEFYRSCHPPRAII